MAGRDRYVLVTGSLTAPMVEGVYTLSLSNLKAGVVDENATGDPYWATEPAATGTIINLTITVSTTLMPPAEIAAAGPRYVSVTAPLDVGEVALLLMGDPANPDVSCVSAYVQADATLDTTPVFQDGSVWGTVYIKVL